MGMKRALVPPNDPILLKIAESIAVSNIPGNQTQQLIEELLCVAYDNRIDRQKPIAVGLAAPQVGISKRIIAVDIGADGKGGLADLRVYINPEITWCSEDTNEWYEGCWSTDRVCGIVSRPTSIKIKAYTREGKPVEEEYSGYVARIFQHETDHLDGDEFITHISDDNNLHWVEPEEFPEYRNNQAWRTWPKKCPRTKWEHIKGLTQ